VAKFNLIFSLNSYEDSASSNNPNMSHFKWTRQLSGANAEEPFSIQTLIHAGEESVIFDDSISLSQDNTTNYDLSFISNGIYELKHKSGTAPNFKTKRAIGGDPTTQITISVTGNTAKIENTAGLALDFSTVQIGDEAILQAPLSSLNIGKFIVLSKNATSITVENKLAVPESLVFGADEPLIIQSSSGIKVGDRISLPSAFGASVEGVYSVKSVLSDKLTFVSTMTLPNLENIQSQISAFSKLKKIVYIENSKPVNITINNTTTLRSIPAFDNSPAVNYFNQPIWSLKIESVGVEGSSVFVASIE
jgi:hypothetical protein